MGGHGNGDHGHGHGQYTIPKASIYKIEDAPELVEVQKALAKRGLKDPWLRNEVWRHDPRIFGTHGQRLRKFMLRGIPLGAALAVATVALEFALGGGSDHGHDAHGHEGGAHH